MEAKLLAVFTAGLDGVNVTRLCDSLGITRQTLYKYRQRYEDEGPAGLVERSRAPHTSPHAISLALEDEIVRLRKTSQVDNGAQMIAYHLQRHGWPGRTDEPVPAVSTIHRVLVRRGLVIPQPQKRPKSATRRFVWPKPNDAWQIDATCWALADGTGVWIMDLLDDHSRVLGAALACTGPTGDAAWDAFCDASARWGLPAHLMSDNGTCFTGRFVGGGQVDFERRLDALGIRHIRSTPGHPQTCGKIERSHQTTKRWLGSQPTAETIAELQAQLDHWLRHYNHHRPHRALHGATPAEAWHATPRAAPGLPISPTPDAVLRTVDQRGLIAYRNKIINIGAVHRSEHVLLIARGDDLTIFGADGLLHRLTLTPGTRYYSTKANKRIIGPCH